MGIPVSANLDRVPVTWAQLARWRDWSTSKLPYLAATAFLLAGRDATALETVAMVATIIGAASFGYCVNDVADRSSDARAGKPNRAAQVPTAKWAALMLLSAAGSIALSFIWAADVAGPILVITSLISAAAYSLPPVRLKERGIAGILAGAASQWVLPALAMASQQPGGWMRPRAWAVAVLGLAIGMRWMAVHQMQDAIYDRRADVATFASQGGQVDRVLLATFCCELLLLPITLTTYAAGVALALLVLHEIVVQRLRPPLSVRLSGYDDAPLSEYYFLLLPVALAVERSLRAPAYLLLAGALFLIGSCYIGKMIAEWRDVLR
jgi:4-hydroxybenzoate polyprenyltransferase